MSTNETRIRESQVRTPESFDDTLPAGAQLQEEAVHLEDVVKGIISQIRRISGTARWYEGLGDARSLLALHTDLMALESKAFIHRSCPGTILVGDIVSVLDGEMADRANVSKLNESVAIGVVLSKPNETSAIIQLTGKLDGVYGDLIPGKTYFVGENGRPRLGAPVPKRGERMFVQAIGSALSESSLLLSNNFNITSIRG